MKQADKRNKKGSRYEIDAIYLLFGGVFLYGSAFLNFNTEKLLAVYLFIPLMTLAISSWNDRCYDIALYNGDIIDLAFLLKQEGLALTSSGNIYLFSSNKLSLTPKISCIALLIDKGVKLSAERFLIERLIEKDLRMKLVDESNVGEKKKEQRANPNKRIK